LPQRAFVSARKLHGYYKTMFELAALEQNLRALLNAAR